MDQIASLSRSSLPHLVKPGEDDEEVRELIESWRYTGAATPWEAVVGHAKQVMRCREVVERMRRPAGDLERLGLRLARGMVISGPPGSGKTLLARALATAAGRDAIVPPTAELTAELVGRMYAQLGRMDPVVVILDEAEAILGASVLKTTDSPVLRALLAALDGINRPERGPLTIALTTMPAWFMDAGATRAGRLAPRLELSRPNEEERRLLFERAIADVPKAGSIEVDRLVARTGSWTGAEIDTAVEEAISRSLIDGTDALRMDLLMEVITERYVVEDVGRDRGFDPITAAHHEAGHAIYASLIWPGRVASVELNNGGGETKLVDENTLQHTASGMRSLAGVFLAGMASDFLIGGHGGMTRAAQSDRVAATRLLRSIHSVTSPFEPEVLEGGDEAEKGSERMRATIAVDVEREANGLYIEVIRDLAVRLPAVRHLAQAVLASRGHNLAGAELTAAIEAALVS
jgi:cell division protease FtsH